MTLQERITSAAAQNAQWLKTLGETDYAACAVEQNKTYIAELRAQIVVDAKNVKVLGFKCDKERSEYEMYRDSHVKRLAYRMRGKKEDFQSRTAKEEREYQDALQALVQAKKRLETLQSNLKDTKAMQPELEAISARHTAAQTQLDALYNSIFSGPTPEFPAEDAAEEEVRRQQALYAEIQRPLTLETQIDGLLTDANKFLQRALKDIEDALSASTVDIWGGGTLADMAERSAMSQAQQNCSQAEMLVDMARRLQPLVHSIGPLELVQGDFVRNILFDDIFSDLEFRERIKSSKEEIKRSKRKLNDQLAQSKQRLQACTADASAAQKTLEEARSRLQRVRMEAFQRVAGAGGGIEAQKGATAAPTLNVALPPYAP